MVVSVTIIGGLGNQLFQIFCCISYANHINQTFIFPYLPSIHELGHHRYTGAAYFDSFLLPLKIYTTYSESKINTTQQNIEIQNTFRFYFEDEYQSYNKIPKYDYKSICLDGYFQSYKYFEGEYDNIINIISLRQQQSAIHDECLHYFPSDTTVISMHFRIGDFKGIAQQNCFIIINYEYYENALNYLLNEISEQNKQQKKVLNIQILYFCEKEDIDYVESLISLLKSRVQHNADNISIRFVRVDDSIVDWKQLLLMSLCHHNIIANSTFSWWAAYFNKYLYKLVTYPSVWFGRKCPFRRNAKDMFPLTWKKFESWERVCVTEYDCPVTPVQVPISN